MNRPTWYVVTIIDGTTYTVHQCASTRHQRAEREARDVRESLRLDMALLSDAPLGIDVRANAVPVRE